MADEQSRTIFAIETVIQELQQIRVALQELKQEQKTTNIILGQIAKDLESKGESE